MASTIIAPSIRASSSKGRIILRRTGVQLRRASTNLRIASAKDLTSALSDHAIIWASRLQRSTLILGTDKTNLTGELVPCTDNSKLTFESLVRIACLFLRAA